MPTSATLLEPTSVVTWPNRGTSSFELNLAALQHP
jgi:hypothetical protein